MKNTYIIKVEQMEFRAYHGCYELERKVGNRFAVDVEVEAVKGKIFESDRVEDGVSYLTIYEVAREQMARTQHTVEVVAQNIIDAIREKYATEIVEVRCTVAKLAPPLGGKVASASVTLRG
ncbi:MAG: dihydroneopterin aldolase [Rikenellaceae bacterium]